jgi:hypothetical protein
MSFITAYPDKLSAAASHLESIGTTFNAGNAVAAGPITGVVPAAADEVSALTAAQFAAHGARYQALSAQVAAIHNLLVAILAAGAGSYAATEAANAASTV